MGIICGKTETVFDPSANITRAEFAAICARFADKDIRAAAQVDFTDVEGHWAKDEIILAAELGWILGDGNGSFRPNANISRAEAMSLLNRVLQRRPESVNALLSEMIVWDDNRDTEAWYYLAVQEATNSHDYTRGIGMLEAWTELKDAPDWSSFEK